ncbi:hypothetical protein IRY61_05075 [Candidatus Saccharibacteria bacterium]|nr:hypothetical protein [Candidatus Saccharibacteria bacterium]
MRVNEVCKTCELRCELARIERDLGAAILRAHERRGQALTGMEIASNVVGDSGAGTNDHQSWRPG